MKEFMLLVRNGIDHQAGWSPERHQQFLAQCEDYIGSLKGGGNLVSAQPLQRTGSMVSRPQGAWIAAPFSDSNEVIVGYYHILARDMEDAVEIARRNPEFSFGTTARIEVRPVKANEESTGFVYPQRQNASEK